MIDRWIGSIGSDLEYLDSDLDWDWDLDLEFRLD